MKMNDNQPIVDALLDEWLGKKTPNRISASDLGMRRIDPERAAELEQALQSATNDLRNRSLASSASLYRKPKTNTPVFRVLAALAACWVVGASIWTIINRDHLGLPKLVAPTTTVAKDDSSRKLEIGTESSASVASLDDRSPILTNPGNTVKPKADREALPLDSLPFNKKDAVAEKTIPRNKTADRTTKLDEQDVIKAIDRGMQQVWINHDAKPAAPIDGAAWIERATQKLLSRPANQQEKDVFAKKDNLSLRLESLHQIVESSEFSQVWARRLAAFYLDVEFSSMRDPSPERKAFVQWIRSEINQTHRLDSVVKNIVLAKGIGRSNGEVAPSTYWWTEVGMRNTTAPAEVIASKFLGTRASCSRCHDASTVANSDQVRFWGVAAITQGIEISQTGLTSKPETRFRKEDAPLFYERDDATMVAALPSLPNGQTLKAQRGSPSELATITKQNLASLSNWMLQSDDLAKSHVDFVWKSILGQPLIGNYPLDDAEGARERRELADVLGQQLRSNDYDLRKLVTWIAASQVFGLESIRPGSDWYLTATNKDLALYQQRQRLFASFPVSQEPAFRSIDNLASWFDSSKVIANESGGILANLLPPTLPAGKSAKSVGGNSTPSSQMTKYTEAQVQYLVNAQLLPNAVQEEVDRMIKSKLAWNVLVDHAFYMTGTSLPSQVDRDAAQRILDMSRDNRLAISRIIAARL